MPKKELKEVQEIRKDLRMKAKKYPVSTVYLQVVGSGAPGTPRSLYVFTEHCKFLFNCGEGTQRLAFENKVKLGMLEHVFVTYKKWDNVGGLPGMLLTLQDTGVPQITLHGPPGIESIYYDTKHFMRFADLNIQYKHYKENVDTFGNPGDPLMVKAIPLRLKTANLEELHAESEKDFPIGDVGDLFSHETSKNSAQPNEQVDDNSRLKQIEENIRFKELSLAYICRPPPKPGALHSKKCRELGVPAGPLMGKLKSGIDVTLPNGNIVHAIDVTEPDDPSSSFIVLEVPTLDHIEPLLDSEEFSTFQKGASDSPPADTSLKVIVHFSPPLVMLDPRYQDWSNRFPKSITHIIINEDSQCMGSERVHKVQYKLNHIYPKSFPLLLDKGIVIENGSNCSIKRLKLDENLSDYDEKATSNYYILQNKSGPSEDVHEDREYNFDGETHQGFTSLTYNIRPNTGIDCSTKLKITPNIYINECYKQENFASILCDVKNNVKKIQSDIPPEIKGRKFPKFTFLGTGSCIPNKTRNTSGIAIDVSASFSMIMDCGEGTYGQLVRLFGENRTKTFLLNLRVIYISHLHADHHIGLIKLICERKKILDSLLQNVEPFFLVAPIGIRYYLSSYSIGFQSLFNQFHLVPNVVFRKSLNESFDSNLDCIKFTKDQVLKAVPLKDIETCYVRHCHDAFGVKITLEDQFKVVYSGDTMPAQTLVDLGHGCDLLIHEATMEDYLEEDARVKRHSTYAQAIEIGNKMEAKNVILTHFSQRYAKVPLIDELPSNVIVAFDNMEVNLSDLPCLPLLYPAFVSIFSDDVDEMKEKTNKRKKREQNEKELSEKS